MNRNKLKLLIDTMFKGDGYCNKYGFKTYTTVSEELALSTFLAVAKLGFLPSFEDSTNVAHGYEVVWKENAEIFYAKQNENYMFLPVSSIERKTYEGYVYNLEVEDDNSYVAEVIAVHNCEGFGYYILEAYACGKPVLALDTFGVNELVKDGETGLLVKTEPPSELTAIGKHFLIRRPDREDYIKKTITLLADEELRRKLGENAKKEVEKYHFRKVYKVFL
jgi:glycosyltransferase involved in cell wall biosynthesis